MYAIVDIETTGGNAGSGKMTEIAIIVSDGTTELDRFTTLINPMQPIPLFIEKLTGISDELVKNAPVFSEVADRIFELLRDKVFVAHNVNFDFSFVAHQLQQHGHTLSVRKLCTVRWSRKVFEQLDSYSLGNLCRSLSIPISDRHRAMGDAQATATLFHRLMERDQKGYVQQMLKKGSMDSYLPIHLSNTDVESMPNVPGIYYFHDKKGKIIYVGKAIRLRKRVTSHFSNNDVSKRKQELLRNVHRITYKACGNELMMSVMESLEIKKIWPEFNRSQKRFENRFGICSFLDQQGVLRLGIVKKKRNLQVHASFPLYADGIRLLNGISKEYKLCPRMCFIQKDQVECTTQTDSPCEGICVQEEQVEHYNKKVTNAILQLHETTPVVAVFGEGRDASEFACVLLGKKDFLGVGFISVKERKSSIKKLTALLEPQPINEFVRSLVLYYAEQHPEQAVYFN
ncbi:MAG: DNA polymerase III subunit epsilon [Bacteroidetes bacterium]|nr:DNA polymerase III subunit epsilon [Bacteroidota bacterium]